jgi:hypothetical protein
MTEGPASFCFRFALERSVLLDRAAQHTLLVRRVGRGGSVEFTCPQQALRSWQERHMRMHVHHDLPLTVLMATC